MCIKPRRNENQFRSTFLDGVLQHSRKFVVILLPRNSKLQREIPGRSQTVTLSGFVGVSSSGIKRESMSRKEMHTIRLIENILCAVSVMGVPIHDHDAIQFVFFQS